LLLRLAVRTSSAAYLLSVLMRVAGFTTKQFS